MHQGYFAYRCLLYALQLRMAVSGVVMIADDAVIRPWFPVGPVHSYRAHLLWHRLKGHWFHSQHGAWGRRPLTRMAKEWAPNDASGHYREHQALIEAFEASAGANLSQILLSSREWSPTDVALIPKRMFETVRVLGGAFSEHNVFHELVMPKLGRGFGWAGRYNDMGKRRFNRRDVDLPGHSLWQDRRNLLHYLNLPEKEAGFFLHPVKLRAMGHNNEKNAKLRKKFCDSYVQSWLNYYEG